MKILMITESFASGVLQIMKDIVNNIVTNDVKVYIIYSRRIETPVDEELKSLLNENVTMIEVKATRNINPIKDFRTLLSYINIIREIKPNIIHLHSSKAGVLGRIASLFYKSSRVFYTPHGFAFLRLDISPLKRKIYKLIEQLMGYFPGKIITVSDTENDIAKALVNPNKVKLIYNGLDIKNIKSKVNEEINNNSISQPMLELLQNKVVITTVGRLSYQKNPMLAIEFVKKLKEEIKQEFIFIWIGGGELEEQVYTQIKEYNLEDHFHISGWLNREVTLSVLEKYSDYYVQFSLWEGLPVSVLEAMYLGMAPIVTNIVGNKDAVVNGKTGYVINSVDEAVKAFKSFLESPEQYQIMCQNAIRRVEDKFNMELMVENYKSLYGLN